jgi:hypothetical protein
MPRKPEGDHPLTPAERQARCRQRVASRAADQAAELGRLRARVAELEAAQIETGRDSILASRLVAIARDQASIRRSLDRKELAAMRASLAPTSPARQEVDAWIAALTSHQPAPARPRSAVHIRVP